MPFLDRQDAGRRLAQALMKYKGPDVVVLALPRGGAEVAAEVAQALSAPLDLLLVRKIGAPTQPELAIGAVVDGGTPIVVRNERLIILSSTTAAEFDAICKREVAEIERRRQRYLANRPAINPAGKIVIVVDDGIATGATARAALRAVRQRQPKKLVLAVPVAPADTIETLRSEVDDVVCLEMPYDLGAIGYFYSDFHQLSDDDVTAVLSRFPPSAAQSTVDQGPK